MAEPKTRPTDASVASFLDTVEPEAKCEDCWTLVRLMEKLTDSKPVLWGTSIVGFGTYTYVNTTGQPADWPIAGFSPRKANLTIYITPGFDRYESLLSRLGKHTTGKSCLYIRKLADIDLAVLEELVGESVALMRERYPTK